MDAMVSKSKLIVMGFAPSEIVYDEDGDYVGVSVDESLYEKPLKVTETDGVYSVSLDEEAYNQQLTKENKTYRDMCLQKTDFTQLPDTGLTNVEEWATFRLTMRTLDLTPPVTWPAEPSSPWGPFLPTPPS
jgi:uncharacterized protein YwlG (UPF0340 family)